MEQSDQPQRELILATFSSLQQQDSRYRQLQDSDRLAVSAFIEYLQVLQEELADKREWHFVPFDTGLYQAYRDHIPSALYFFAFLINCCLD